MHSAYKKTIRSENPIWCSKCHILITDDTAKYCPHCGAKIENEISTVLIATQNQQKTIDNRKSTQSEPTEKPSNPPYTRVNVVPDVLIKKEQNVSQKIRYENPTNRSVSAMKTKPEEVERTIVRPHPVLIIKPGPSNRGEILPLQDKSIHKEQIQDPDLNDYSDAAKSLKKLDDFFEDAKPLKDQESVQNNDDFDKDNLPYQISIPAVDTTTDQEPDNARSFTGESLVKFPGVEPGNTSSLTKDIDFSIIQESEEAVHTDPDYISIDWGEVERKRREHNNNKSKMEVMLGQHDDVLSDEIKLTSSPPKEKPAINQNQGYDLQFPSDTLKRLDSRYYPVLKNIEGLTEISTENFTKILIQCNLGAISLTPTLDDINEWAEEVLNFENPLLEIQENTIRINMR
jgi:RNA polymerase subunit RPABC4/transcription elongation factor Spt4